jgi:hypothetical protein
MPSLLALLVPLALAGGGHPAKPASPEKVEALKQRREGSLTVGSVAPDAAVFRPDGTLTTVLAAKQPDRPLVLIFGSFT